MKRIATALVLTPLVVWMVLWAPVWAFDGLLAAVGLIAFYEFDRIAAAQGIVRAGWPGMAAGLALLFAPEPFLVVIVVALAAMVLALSPPKKGMPRSYVQTDGEVIPTILSDLTTCLPGAASFLLGVIYIFGAWRCAMGLREINPHWLMIALLVSWAGDTAALYVGRAFGRHKMAPHISPHKTWEGAVGSVIGGTAAAGIYAHYLIPPAALWGVLALGAGANIAGQLGDLCESAFKRGAGVKDSGTTLPGHGGWLDRIDSSLFSVPATYVVLKYLLL
jgi:phosphatidate cytidylyltransferase